MASESSILLLINLALGESSYGSYADWGAVADANLSFLEATVGEVTSKTLTSSNVTLSDTEERSLLIKLSGTLSANVEVRTNDRKGFWFVTNTTTGDFTVTFKPTSGTGIVVPQGGTAILVCDGTNTTAMSKQTAAGNAQRPTLTVKTGGYTALAADDGNILRFTTAATLAFTAAATLGAKWSVLVQAAGVAVTLDPDASEQINGANTLALPAGAIALVTCSGTAFTALVWVGGDSAVAQADNVSTRGADIASATTTDIGAATGVNVTITGTTTITGLGTKAAGVIRRVTFAGALTFTHNGTSLILPGGANIPTAAGDVAIMESLGSGNWRCLSYQKASGLAVVVANPAMALISAGALTGANVDIVLTSAIASGFKRFKLTLDDVEVATDGATIDFLISTNAGSSFITTNYRIEGVLSANASVTGVSSAAGAAIPITGGIGNAADERAFLNGEFKAGVTWFDLEARAQFVSTAGVVSAYRSTGSHKSANVDAIRIKPSSGNFDAGGYTLWGIRES